MRSNPTAEAQWFQAAALELETELEAMESYVREALETGALDGFSRLPADAWGRHESVLSGRGPSGPYRPVADAYQAGNLLNRSLERRLRDSGQTSVPVEAADNLDELLELIESARQALDSAVAARAASG